jgi:hypothetical protein
VSEQNFKESDEAALRRIAGENLALQARIDRATKLLTDYDSGGVRVVSVRQVLDALRPDVQG